MMKIFLLVAVVFASCMWAVRADDEPVVEHPSPRVISTAPPQMAEPKAPMEEIVTLSGTLYASYDNSGALLTIELRADNGGEYQIMLTPENRALAQWHEKRVTITGTVTFEANVQWVNVQTCDLSPAEL